MIKNNVIKELKKDYLEKKHDICIRLKEFSVVRGADIFYELCFCLLTPQTNAKAADKCVQELKKRNFLNKEVDPKPILMKKVRFHNNKSNYLLELKKKYLHIKKELSKGKDNNDKRDFLINNVRGMNLKESSHFLRNIGHRNLAILDRHILKNLEKYNVIGEIPKTLTRKEYLGIEKRFRDFSRKINISMDELDLLFWSSETGEIFK